MKKSLYKIIALFGVVTSSFWATSCLKDNFTDFSKVGTVIEFVDAIAGTSTALSFGNNAPDTIWLRLNATGPYAPTHDLAITVGQGTTGITLYNLDNTHVVGTAIPDSTFSLLSTTATITAGKDALGNPNRTALIGLVIYPAKIPATAGVNYVLDIGILSSPAGTTISGNFGDIMFNFYHNPYDGSFAANGIRYNYNQKTDYPGNYPPTGYTGTIPYSFNTTILTVNATTSIVHVGQVDGGLGYMYLTVGSDNITVTIAPILSGTYVTGVAILNTALPSSAGVSSTWNQGTRTFDLYYGWENGAGGTFRVDHETLVHN